MNTIELKIRVLCSGLKYDKNVICEYSKRNFIPKRRAYGTGDSSKLETTHSVPQEVILEDGTIIACNYNENSDYDLIYKNGNFYIKADNNFFKVIFPIKPDIYGIELSDGSRVEEYVTVYGDTTLGFFSPGHCYYFNDGRQCKFCSLGEARNSLSDHKKSIRPSKVIEVMNIIEANNINRYKRVLINGGTTRNYDIGFEMHKQLLISLKPFCEKNNLNSHLISMPPRNLNKIKGISEFVDSWAISLEIFNAKLFDQICPGKSQDYGRNNLLEAYLAAVSELGEGNVYVGFVAGLEPLNDLVQGMEFFSKNGIVPAIAVFHPDHGSEYQNHPRPVFEDIYKTYAEMHKLYQKYGFKPFIIGSGRNSLDTEAYYGEKRND
ncbi:hypothetical protein C6H65_05180 [Photorhabdus luminescens]|uniref:radical SAM protein n=1 Tax=Photorhabdus hainanensis TaxID=1004166 RepID=UPI000D4C42FF|nr:radical SAM protein [Photorhabdus hainanensis]MBS9432542.1 hypothetical protein [Photorhabdus hainanensis]PQQ42176.1 hypothetical protein C6H65_05180 [Photorhabdus luminescens]